MNEHTRALTILSAFIALIVIMELYQGRECAEATPVRQMAPTADRR